MEKLQWIMLSLSIIGAIGAIVTIYLADIFPPDDIEWAESMKFQIQKGLHDTIIEDIRDFTDLTKSEAMQKPFTLDDYKDDVIGYCGDGEKSDKCLALDGPRSAPQHSSYTFIFPVKGQHIEPDTDNFKIQDCVIEIISITSTDVKDMENKWNDRDWCKTAYQILLTDQYVPRGKPDINVNSLSMRYSDSNDVKMGFVNAYNFDSMVSELISDSSDSFNVILLDENNCISAAVSKSDKGIHSNIDNDGLWKLTNQEGKLIIDNIVTEKYLEDLVENVTEHPLTEKQKEAFNCPENEEKLFLGFSENEKIEVSLNLKGVQGIKSSVLDDEYYVFQVEPIEEDAITSKGIKVNDVKIFDNWTMLISDKKK